MTELLVATFIGLIATMGLLSLFNQLLGESRRDFARSETQREMAQALDYISAELREAVYVYEGECLGISGQASAGCAGRSTNLASSVALPSSTMPVLAFWKLEPVPYNGDQKLPVDCTKLASDRQADCQSLKIARNAYTLVIYALVRNSNSSGLWQGPARIVRYQLRKYKTVTKDALTRAYDGDPSADNFRSWTCRLNDAPCNSVPHSDTLVDYLDFGTTNNSQACPVSYSRVPSKPLSTSFYACVRRPATEGNLDFRQDIIVFLRGNAMARAGFASSSRSSGYLPSLQTQVQARSVFRRVPPMTN